MSAQLRHVSSVQLQLVNSDVGSHAVCQLRRNLSGQLHSVSCVDPLPSLNSILPPKLWAVFLVAINQSRVHAVAVHCIHSMTPLVKQPHVYAA